MQQSHCLDNQIECFDTTSWIENQFLVQSGILSINCSRTV